MPEFDFQVTTYEDDDPWRPFVVDVLTPSGHRDVFRYPSAERRQWALARLSEMSANITTVPS